MLKKYLYKILYPVARIYWSIFQPVTFGVRIMLFNDEQILLVRHTYIPGQLWMLPGGGVGRGEDYSTAIKREIKEELNISLHEIKFFGLYTHNTEGKKDHIILFISQNKIDPTNIKIDPAEIIEYRFFSINQLPINIAPGHTRRIKDFIENKYPACGKW